MKKIIFISGLLLLAFFTFAYLGGWRLEIKKTQQHVGFLNRLYQTKLLRMIWGEVKQGSGEGNIQVSQGTGERKELPESVNRAPVKIAPLRQQLIGVASEPIQYRPLEKVIRTVGRVEVDEIRISEVRTKVSGWVQKVFVNYTWQHVNTGEPLFSIYSPELVTTQREYLLALKGKDYLGNNAFPEVSSGANSLLESTRERLLLWDITETQIRELERTRQVKRDLIIFSPATGHVASKEVFPNKYITPETRLYTIVDHTWVWVHADIYEYEIPFVEVGQKATMVVDAYPGKVFTGKVTYIWPHLEHETRTLKVRMEFPNPDLKLKPEMYAHVEIRVPLGQKLSLPESAVLDSGSRQLVFIDKGDGYFEPRDIKLGAHVDPYYEVISGLKEGERVLKSASFLIDSESQLKAALGSISLSGMVTEIAGAKGEERPEVKEQVPRQKLNIEFKTEPDPPETGENTFYTKVTDPSGKPVSDAEVTVIFFMPAMPSMNMPAMRSETKLKSMGGGEYQGKGQVLMGGAWEVSVIVKQNGQPSGSAGFRINAK